MIIEFISRIFLAGDRLVADGARDEKQKTCLKVRMTLRHGSCMGCMLLLS